MKTSTTLWPVVREYLRSNPFRQSYETVAAAVGSHARGIGSSMRALGNRGHDDLCALVVPKHEL